MCILGLRGSGVKGRAESSRRVGSDAPGPRRARKLAKDEHGPEEPCRPGVPKARVAALLACSWFKSPQGDLPVQLPAMGIGPSTERRVLPRIAGLILTDEERQRARSMFAIALGCKTRFGAMRKGEIVGAGALESRLIIALPCGSRMCEDCDKERRGREAARVEGRWKVFWTLGIPSGKFAVGQAWRSVAKWVGALFRELRREASLRRGSHVWVDEDERARIKAANEELEPGKRKAPAFQYAWCLEPHISGYPHIHFVTNARYIPLEWIKRLWSRIIGATVRWAKPERVYDQDGVCRYLSKYISKTSFPPDLVALMYRRRQWASTVRKRPDEEPEWRPERKNEGRDLALQVTDPEDYARVFGWQVNLAKEGKYALFSRTITAEQYQELYGSERSKGDAETKSRSAESSNGAMRISSEVMGLLTRYLESIPSPAPDFSKELSYSA